MRDLVLYYKPSCPYCQKVLAVCQARDITLPLRDVQADPEALATLIQVGGKKQVPCLFIDGNPLYESDAIIEYLAH